jgi:CheY-like chemotaxis protein
MSSKRALVVDDSKSARAFLSRILERHEITVDAAESAEAAIDYLTRNRPDVIFMDHMMPGMDGFQAVQSIKNNPRTSAIPILMYTSQEGDLYLGQARALGAEGVLPKQIKQSDVTRLPGILLREASTAEARGRLAYHAWQEFFSWPRRWAYFVRQALGLHESKMRGQGLGELQDIWSGRPFRQRYQWTLSGRLKRLVSRKVRAWTR